MYSDAIAKLYCRKSLAGNEPFISRARRKVPVKIKKQASNTAIRAGYFLNNTQKKDRVLVLANETTNRNHHSHNPYQHLLTDHGYRFSSTAIASTERASVRY